MSGKEGPTKDEISQRRKGRLLSIIAKDARFFWCGNATMPADLQRSRSRPQGSSTSSPLTCTRTRRRNIYPNSKYLSRSFFGFFYLVNNNQRTRAHCRSSSVSGFFSVTNCGLGTNRTRFLSLLGFFVWFEDSLMVCCRSKYPVALFGG